MRILVLGDSVPFPRPLKGQPLPATWPAILSKQFSGLDLWQRAKPRASIIEVKRELELFTESLPHFDAVIIQVGIVDCAPRPYPYWLARLLDTMLSPRVLRRFERFAHRYFLWLYRRQWVSSRLFAQTLTELVRLTHERHTGIPILFLPIAPPNRGILATLPGIDASAVRYNKIMSETVGDFSTSTPLIKVLNPYSDVAPLEVTIDDGHHLSVRGHELVAHAIIQELELQFRVSPEPSRDGVREANGATIVSRSPRVHEKVIHVS